MGKADLHLHTSLSDALCDIPELLDHIEARTTLDVVGVTDHDDLRGAWQARERWAQGRYRFEVIPGMEVTTVEGHLLALFIESPVASLRPLEETLAAIHKQGGLAVVPHPFTWLTRSLGLRHLRRVLANGNDGVHVDGIEVTNQTPAGRLGTRQAVCYNRDEFHLPEAGGSDAHFLSVVGTAHTEFKGRTADDLRNSLAAGTTRGVSGRHPSLREIGLRQVARQTYRGLMATPRAMGWGPTARSFVRRIVQVR
jgi:predicted metal-dependent phosphoesterase TrpH